MNETDDENLVEKEKLISGVCEGFYGRPWNSIQRKKLFEMMKDFQMNTYLYAPKDDNKHRAAWRDLYTNEETLALRCLIDQCRDGNKVQFVYAISPGLDILYSSMDDLTTLTKKLQQVASCGCESFAILFDDIENELQPQDKVKYSSFAHAQSYVTNYLYEQLNKPKLFFFCPTEYCGSRALPDIKRSQYLNTIGSELDKNIKIFWTGDKVISKVISLKHIKLVREVLQRKPLIWDNLHANDYDQRRVYFGPYKGRPTSLLSEISGVLTNPNCEFSLNFIAFHTLAYWINNGNKLREEKLKDEQIYEKMINCAAKDWLNDINRLEDCSVDSYYAKPLTFQFTQQCPLFSGFMNESFSLTGNGSQQNGKPDEKMMNDDDAMSVDDTTYVNLTEEQVFLLIDIFHLPFDYGMHSLQVIRRLFEIRQETSKEKITSLQFLKAFHEKIKNLTNDIIRVRNRSVIFDLYSYIWELYGTCRQTVLWSEWIYSNEFFLSSSQYRLINTGVNWFTEGYLDIFLSGDEEPWYFRGGLIGEMQRMLPMDSFQDLLINKVPVPPTTVGNVIIRPLIGEKYGDYREKVKMLFFDEYGSIADNVKEELFQLEIEEMMSNENYRKHSFVIVREMNEGNLREDENEEVIAAIVAHPNLMVYAQHIQRVKLPQLKEKFISSFCSEDSEKEIEEIITKSLSSMIEAVIDVESDMMEDDAMIIDNVDDVTDNQIDKLLKSYHKIDFDKISDNFHEKEDDEEMKEKDFYSTICNLNNNLEKWNDLDNLFTKEKTIDNDQITNKDDDNDNDDDDDHSIELKLEIKQSSLEDYLFNFIPNFEEMTNNEIYSSFLPSTNNRQPNFNNFDFPPPPILLPPTKPSSNDQLTIQEPILLPSQLQTQSDDETSRLIRSHLINDESKGEKKKRIRSNSTSKSTNRRTSQSSTSSLTSTCSSTESLSSTGNEKVDEKIRDNSIEQSSCILDDISLKSSNEMKIDVNLMNYDDILQESIGYVRLILKGKDDSFKNFIPVHDIKAMLASCMMTLKVKNCTNIVLQQSMKTNPLKQISFPFIRYGQFDASFTSLNDGTHSLHSALGFIPIDSSNVQKKLRDRLPKFVNYEGRCEVADQLYFFYKHC
ncbi:hypothetical protein SNEBB_006369 [Seison nebaliae]|nr:hypothetical protein SNEBB_006369 [Seison nebaliae]